MRTMRSHASTGAAACRAGFTLIEAILAVTLGTVIVLMASGVFLVQSDFYDFLVRQSRVQDDARSVMAFIREIVPTIPRGGVVVAQADRFVVRRPQTLAVGCANPGGNDLHVSLSNGLDSVDPAVARGVARYTPPAGGAASSWTFHPTSVQSLLGSSGAVPAAACFAAGVDTAGAYDDFVEFNGIGSIITTAAKVSDVFMIYEDFEITIAPSALDTLRHALYQGISGAALVEFASGLDATSRFEYRVNGSWSSAVSGGGLTNIDAIRVTANTALSGSAAANNEATFTLETVIPLGGAW
ncbi:MAG: hypothetical protein RQ745_06605 [Longimicrobiales bacterium]|nr:hypothetical protein [Longimicrobiales bacterium]